MKSTFENDFLCIDYKPKYTLRKAPKKLLCSDLKSTHSQLSLEKKINVVAILDRSVANFEVNLILASHRLADV